MYHLLLLTLICACGSSESAYININCSALNFSNDQCTIECEYYNNQNLYYEFIQHYNITTLMQKLNDTNINETLLLQTVRWFTLSSYPFEYYGNVQPELCQYSLGTYCNIIGSGVGSGDIYMMHGCCIPTHCKGQDAIKLLQTNSFCFQSYNEYLPGDKNIICSILPREFDTQSIIFIVICVLILLFVMFSTKRKADVVARNTKISIVLEAFCFQRNWNSFIKTRDPQHSEWSFIDGIRVISAFWIVLFHSREYFFRRNEANRPVVIGDYMNWLYPPYALDSNSDNIYNNNNNWKYFLRSSFSYLLIENLACMWTFFWMGGFFATLSMIRVLRKWKYKRSYFLQTILLYIKRWFRLVIPFAFIMFFIMYIEDQIPYSYNVTSRNIHRDYCSRAWYHAIFMYYNIYYAYQKIYNNTDLDLDFCNLSEWYIYTDFQLYLFLPIICFIYLDIGYKYSVCMCIVMILSCIVVRFIMGFYYNFYEQPYEYGTKVKNDGNLFFMSYFQAWSWVACYYFAVVFMLSLLHFKHKLKDFRLSERLYWFLYGLSITLIASYMLTPYSDFYNYPNKQWGSAGTNVFYALGAQSYCVGLSIFVFVLRFSPKYHYSFVKNILQSNGMQITAKLTYVIYLIHVTVLQSWRLNLNYPFYFSWTNWFVYYIAVSVVCIMISFIIWCCIENPFNYLVASIWRNYVMPIYSPSDSAELMKNIKHFELNDLQDANTN